MFRMKVLRIQWKFVLAAAVFLLVVLLLALYRRRNYQCGTDYLHDASMQHVLEYCNDLSTPTHGLEGFVALTSEQYELRSVHVVIRHGDRYLLHSLPNYHNIPVNCQASENLLAEVPEMTNYVRSMRNNSRARQRHQTFHDKPTFPDKKVCEVSDLTPEGAAQHIRNGQFLKSVYLDKLNLLDTSKYTYDDFFMRCSRKLRTYQSGLALLHGFLPKLDLSKVNIQAADNNSMCSNETGHPCYCPSIHLDTDFMSCNYKQHAPEMKERKQTRKVYEQLAKVFGDDVYAGAPSHIFDVNMIHVCHKRGLPNAGALCEKSETVRGLFDVLVENGQDQVDTQAFQKIARLKMQPLMYEMVDRMLKQASRQTKVKFVLYSGHDTTVEPLAAALGFSTGRWPPYASRIVFELYIKKRKKTPFFRVLFNGVPVTHDIPFCKSHVIDKDEGLCPLSAFRSFVTKDNFKEFGSDTYTEACSKPSYSK